MEHRWRNGDIADAAPPGQPQSVRAVVEFFRGDDDEVGLSM
jgi:hypothetical protein